MAEMKNTQRMKMTSLDGDVNNFCSFLKFPSHHMPSRILSRAWIDFTINQPWTAEVLP